jgi:hypothetical protein
VCPVTDPLTGIPWARNLAIFGREPVKGYLETVKVRTAARSRWPEHVGAGAVAGRACRLGARPGRRPRRAARSPHR